MQPKPLKDIVMDDKEMQSIWEGIQAPTSFKHPETSNFNEAEVTRQEPEKYHAPIGPENPSAKYLVGYNPPESDRSPIVFRTKFQFLKCLEAHKEGNFNLIIGRIGSGKTDLILSLAAENAINGQNTLVLLSEGRASTCGRQIRKIITKKCNDKVKQEEALFRIAFVEEKELPERSPEEYGLWLSSVFKIVRDLNTKCLYIDNLTTLSFTNSTPQVESHFIFKLSKLVDSHSISFTGLIHEKKTTERGEMNLHSHRGNANHTQIAHNVFTFNNYENLDPSLRTITIIKSREFGEHVKRSFKLIFKKLSYRGFYSKDELLEPHMAKRYSIENSKPSITARNSDRTR